MTLMTQTLLHLALASIAVGVVIAAALLLRFGAGRDAVMRYRVMVCVLPASALVLIAQATAPLIAPEDLALSLPVSLTPALPPTVVRPLPAVQDTEADRASGELVHAAPSTGGLAAPPVGLRWEDMWRRSSPWVWAAGVAVCVGVGLRRIAVAIGVVRRSAVVIAGSQLEHFEAERAAVGVRRRVALLATDLVHSPSSWGLWRPAVLLPVRESECAAGQIGHALRHELIHIRRRDAVIEAASLLLTALFWFHPLVWVHRLLLARDCEASCDALVVRGTGRAREYALALLAYCSRPRGVASALVAMGSADSVRRRLDMLRHALEESGPVRRRLLGSLGLAALVLTACGHAVLSTAAAQTRSEQRATNLPMRAEIQAPAGERSPLSALPLIQMLTRRQPTEPDPVRVEELLEAVKRGDTSNAKRLAEELTKAAAGNPAGGEGSVTEQETVVSAQNAKLNEETIEASEFNLSLPEGSKLRAVFEGKQVELQPGEFTRILVTGGEMRIVDETGVVRATVRPTNSAATLFIMSIPRNGEFDFEVCASDGKAPSSILAIIDAKTGVPVDEQPKKNGEVRWELQGPQEDEPGLYRLKMQWLYQVGDMKVQPR